MPVVGDDIDEADEKLRITMSAAIDGTITDATGSATIIDDDDPPDLRVEDVGVTEGTGGSNKLEFTIALSAPSGRTILLGYTTIEGTATAGTDYQEATEFVTLSPGDRKATVTIAIAPNQTLEDDETFQLMTFGGSNVIVEKGTATGTIVDDDLNLDNMPAVRISDATLHAEGGTGSRTVMRFTVTASTTLPRVFGVRYATRDETATAGADYEPVEGPARLRARGDDRGGRGSRLGRSRSRAQPHLRGRHQRSGQRPRHRPATGRGTIVDDDVGGGPIKVSSTVKLDDVLCRSRRCRGVSLWLDRRRPRPGSPSTSPPSRGTAPARARPRASCGSRRSSPSSSERGGPGPARPGFASCAAAGPTACSARSGGRRSRSCASR